MDLRAEEEGFMTEKPKANLSNENNSQKATESESVTAAWTYPSFPLERRNINRLLSCFA